MNTPASLLTAAALLSSCARAPCGSRPDAVQVGSLAPAELAEASGVGVSSDETTLWVQSDGGDPRFYGVPLDGGATITVDVLNATLTDWEDLAVDVAGGRVLIADLGDNDLVRGEGTVWVVPEPDPDGSSPALVEATAWPWVWPDGPRDAEGLAWDPVDGVVVAVTKDEGAAEVWVMAEGGAPERVATLPVGSDALPGGDRVVAADLSRDGALFVVRTDDVAWAWTRGEGQSLADALAASACALPVADVGEAIGLDSAGGYYTVAEGSGSPIWYVAPES